VQNAVTTYLEEQDKDNHVLSHLKGRMLETMFVLHERKNRVKVAFAPMQQRQVEEYVNAQQTYKLLTTLCEGHNAAVQNALREQPHGNGPDVNLVRSGGQLPGVVDLLLAQVESAQSLKRMEELEVALLCDGLDCLSELVQGPCPQNQELVCLHPGVVNALDMVLGSPFHGRVSRGARLSVKVKALALLASLLEGRADLVCHRVIAAEILPAALEVLRTYLIAQHKEATKELQRDLSSSFSSSSSSSSSSSKAGGGGGGGGDGESGAAAGVSPPPSVAAAAPEDPDDLLEVGLRPSQSRRDEAMRALVSLSSVYVELSLVPSFASELVELTDKRRSAHGRDAMDDNVGQVEVRWNGRVESVSFPLPPESPYLSAFTKQFFMQVCDLSTSEKRMKTLFEHNPTFYAEMERIHELAMAFRVFKLVARNIVAFKSGLYACVVLLNLNLLMVTFGRDSDYGYNELYKTAFDPGDKAASVYLTVFLVLFLIWGYCVVIVYHGLTEVPILIKQVDDKLKQDLADPTIKVDRYRDASAFTVWGAVLAFNLVFIVMHATNYGGGQGGPSSSDTNQLRLYAFLILGVSLPWTLLCIRNWIKVPHTVNARRYVLVFDTVFTKSFLRNHTVLIGLCVAGFVRNEFYSLMLLDIINNSVLLQNILKCVTIPKEKLGMVFYLFVVIAMIYAHFALSHFEEYMTFNTGSEMGEQGCHSAVSCFWLIMYKAVPSKKLDPIMRKITNRNMDGASDYQLRMVFDLVFFIFVGVILMSIITGLMLDTFGKLRQAAAARDDKLKNTCFVSGITRTEYDDMALQGVSSFDDLNKVDQNPWSYVYFCESRKQSIHSQGAAVSTAVSVMFWLCVCVCVCVRVCVCTWLLVFVLLTCFWPLLFIDRLLLGKEESSGVHGRGHVRKRVLGQERAEVDSAEEFLWHSERPGNGNGSGKRRRRHR
jgi:hypothetical protein